MPPGFSADACVVGTGSVLTNLIAALVAKGVMKPEEVHGMISKVESDLTQQGGKGVEAAAFVHQVIRPALKSFSAPKTL